jgi:hypothetical protein
MSGIGIAKITANFPIDFSTQLLFQQITYNYKIENYLNMKRFINGFHINFSPA